MNQILWIIIACGALSIVYGALTTRSLLAASAGTARMQEIAAAIQEGASAYLARQYTTIAIVGVVIFGVLAYLLSFTVAIGFLIGAILSGSAGFIGMLVSVRANVRTTQASSEGLGQGLSMAFKAGAVTGLLVAGLALLGVTIYYSVLTQYLGYAPNDRRVVDALVALGFGASLISIFARLGGGIFTKGADVGGDLVGKVEAGIPEDDPRNPATIADNVGDNVGDCAGMAADLFETYAVTVVATMVLSSIFFAYDPDLLSRMMIFPLAIGGACVVTSILGTFFVRLGSSNSIMGALYKGFIATGIFSLIALYPLTAYIVGMGTQLKANDTVFTGLDLFYCGIVGLVVTTLIVVITEYYTGTGYRPVKSIAQASVTGHGTNVIQGLAVSLESTALPALVIMAGILVAFNLAGLYGIAIAVTTMLALAGMVVALDAFGPVTDNAGGIAEMADLPSSSARPPTRSMRWATPQRRSRRVTPSVPPASGLLCCSPLTPRILSTSSRRRPPHGALPVLPRRERRLLALEPVCGGRSAVRRSSALPVCGYGHDRCRPRRRLHRGGSAQAVPREARHHARDREAGLRQSCRYADEGGHQGDDHPIDAACALSDCDLRCDRALSPGNPQALRRSARCCSA